MKLLRAFDKRQQRSRWLAIPVAVIKKFSDDDAAGLAAQITYYGFFSLFPLLLVLFTVLAYVLHGDPSAQRSISDSVLREFPIIGPDLQRNIHTLHGHALALLVGILGAMLGGLGVTQATQNAFARIWAVPHKQRPDFLRSRLRGLGLLVALGLLFIVSTLASGLVTGGLGGPGAKVAGIATSLVADFVLFLAAFRLLTPAIGTGRLWVGVCTAAVLWEIVQSLGGYYVGHVFKHTTNTYGLFGLVIALLVWLHLGALILLYSAELDVVLSRRLYPRSLFGPPSALADAEALTALAKVEERSDEQRVEVEFSVPGDGPPKTGGPAPIAPRDGPPKTGGPAPIAPGDGPPKTGGPAPIAPGDGPPKTGGPAPPFR